MEVARISVGVGADTGQFQSGMQTVDARLKTVQGGLNRFGDTMTRRVTLPLIALGTAIGATIIKVGQWADELLDLSVASGISVEDLQRWRIAAVDAGTSADAFADAVMQMNRRMIQGGEATDRLEVAAGQLGVALYDAAGNIRDTESITRDLVLALANIEDESVRAALGADAFRGAWDELAPIIALGEDAILGFLAAEENIFTREQLEKLDEARKMWDRVKNEIFLATVSIVDHIMEGQELSEFYDKTLKPAIEDVTQKVKDAIDWWRDLDDGKKEVIKTTALVVIAIGPASKIAAALIGLARLIGGVTTGLATLAGVRAGSFAAASASAGSAAAAGGGLFLFNVKLGIVLASVLALIEALKRLDRWKNTGFDMDMPSDRAWRDVFFKDDAARLGTTPGILGSFHTGGEFRAPRLGGEGWALLKDRETVFPAGVKSADGGGDNVITLNITQHITDKSTADYATNQIAKIFQNRGLAGAFR